MSVLNEVLPELQKQTAIVVTGPQRSGTTIAAHIIAKELGYTYVDEDEFGIYDTQRAIQFIKNGRVVLQAPGLMYCCHQLPAALVVMKRPLDEILASEKRIGWREQFGGKSYENERNLYYQIFGFGGEDTAWTKYFVWQVFQRPLAKVWYEVEYDSLKGFDLWRENRENFQPRQWS